MAISSADFMALSPIDVCRLCRLVRLILRGRKFSSGLRSIEEMDEVDEWPDAALMYDDEREMEDDMEWALEGVDAAAGEAGEWKAWSESSVRISRGDFWWSGCWPRCRCHQLLSCSGGENSTTSERACSTRSILSSSSCSGECSEASSKRAAAR